MRGHSTHGQERARVAFSWAVTTLAAVLLLGATAALAPLLPLAAWLTTVYALYTGGRTSVGGGRPTVRQGLGSRV